MRPMIDRTQFLLLAAVIWLIETIALFGLYTCPPDVGCSTGTNPWWNVYSAIGLWIHFPAVAVFGLSRALVPVPFPVVAFVVGFTEMFLFTLLVVICYRSTRELIAMKRKAPA